MLVMVAKMIAVASWSGPAHRRPPGRFDARQAVLDRIGRDDWIVDQETGAMINEAIADLLNVEPEKASSSERERQGDR